MAMIDPSYRLMQNMIGGFGSADRFRSQGMNPQTPSMGMFPGISPSMFGQSFQGGRPVQPQQPPPREGIDTGPSPEMMAQRQQNQQNKPNRSRRRPRQTPPPRQMQPQQPMMRQPQSPPMARPAFTGGMGGTGFWNTYNGMMTPPGMGGSGLYNPVYSGGPDISGMIPNRPIQRNFGY